MIPTRMPKIPPTNMSRIADDEERDTEDEIEQHGAAFLPPLEDSSTPARRLGALSLLVLGQGLTRLNASIARSRCSGSSAADICTRIRAVPSGTTG